jgi:hypothetical protein
MLNITELNIEEWANNLSARSELARLIARLIQETCPDLRELNMPGGDKFALPGFDGFVDCGTGTAFVPQDQSVWELSAEKEIRDKANEVYKLRSDNPSYINKSDTTFVFATCRPFPDAHEWAVKKTAKKTWRRVRVIWSHHLALWLDEAPCTAASFALALGRPIKGIRSIGSIWDAYSQILTDNAAGLNADFVTGGRIDVQERICHWLSPDSCKASMKLATVPSAVEHVISTTAVVPDTLAGHRIRLVAPTFREGVDFIAASIRTYPRLGES